MAIILHHIFNRKEVTKLKRTVVFLLSLLLLGVVSMSGTGNIAFAGPPSPEAAVLLCTVSTSPPGIHVTAISTTVTVTATDCAAALVALRSAGLVIRDIQVLNTSPASVVYTLVNEFF